MLKREHRLRRSADFTAAMRRGRAARTGSVMVHVTTAKEPCPARVGFVVGRAVGGAVVRNSVRRRLRHLMADRLERLPAGAHVVVRAFPEAATTRSRAMARDLDRALETAMQRARSR